MAYKKPFVVSTYTAGGEFVSEAECESVFLADVTAQRESAGAGVSVVKDRRHSNTKILRVWANGRTIFRTAGEYRTGVGGLKP